MPHLIIEASKKLESQIKEKKLMQNLHQIMIDSGLFSVNAIKSRYKFTEDFIVGDDSIKDFIFVQVALLEGRSSDQLKSLGDSLYAALKQEFPEQKSLSLELREMPKDHYFH